MTSQIDQDSILTHASTPKSLETNIHFLQKKIQNRDDLSHTTVTEQLNLLEKLSTFSFGRFLIKNRGLNGYWTDVAVMHPEQGRTTKLNIDGLPFKNLESFLLDKAPIVLATQERFQIFKNENRRS